MDERVTLLTDWSLIVHDVDYRTSWKDWESFVESLTEKIVEKDDTIPELPPKDLVRASKAAPGELAYIDKYRSLGCIEMFDSAPIQHLTRSKLHNFCLVTLILTYTSHISLLHGQCSVLRTAIMRRLC